MRLTSTLRFYVEQFDERVSDEVQSLWDAQDVFTQLSRSSAVVEQINQSLILSQRSGESEPVGSTAEGFVLMSSSNYSLTLTLVQRKPKYMYLYPSNALVSAYGKKALGFARYVVRPQVTDFDTFSTNHTLDLVEQKILPPGEVLRRDGRHDVVDYELGNEPLLLLRLISRSLGGVQWCFDRTTKRPWQAIAAEGLSSRLCSMIRVLGTLRSPTSSGPLEEMSRHRNHFVRWDAVKALAKVSPPLALKRVQDMTSDPHPDVRGAATRTLHRYQQREERHGLYP